MPETADKEPKKAKTPKGKENKSKIVKDSKASKKPKDSKISKKSKDSKVSKKPKDPKASKKPKDSKAVKKSTDSKAPEKPKDSEAPEKSKDTKAPKKSTYQKNPKSIKTLLPRKYKRPAKRQPKEKVVKPRNYKKSKDLLKKKGRLYAKAIFTGYKRSQRNQYTNVALLRVEGAKNQEDAKFYIGKRCCYIYECKRGSLNKYNKRSKMRMIWGKITRVHGNTGSVRAKFTSNLPAYAMSRRIRIMLYPSTF